MNTITVTTTYQGFWALFEASWAGAIEVLNAVYEAGRTDEAMALVAEYAEMVQESTGTPPSDTEINDFIWFSLADEMNLDDDE